MSGGARARGRVVTAREAALVREAIARAIREGRSDQARAALALAGPRASPRVVESVRIGLVGSAIPPADAARVGYEAPSPAFCRIEDVT